MERYVIDSKRLLCLFCIALCVPRTILLPHRCEEMGWSAVAIESKICSSVMGRGNGDGFQPVHERGNDG